MDMVLKMNPFQKAYEVISKSLTADLLKEVQGYVQANKANITEDEINANWHLVEKWIEDYGIAPNHQSSDPNEKRLGLIAAKAIAIFQKAQSEPIAESEPQEGDLI